MNDSDIKLPPPLAAQILKTVGVVLLLSFFVDFLVQVITLQFSNPQWQLMMMNQVIDRGVTPLLAFGFLYAGFWIQTTTAGASTAGERVNPERAVWQDWRFWAFVLSSLLGLLFLLLIPLYLGTTGQLAEQQTTQINQQATQEEILIKQQQDQLQAIANSGQLDQLIKSNQVPPQQLAVLQQLKQDPQALEKQAGQARERVRTQQNQLIEQAQRETLVTRARGSLRSFLLAVGFITIGWSGLRDSR